MIFRVRLKVTFTTILSLILISGSLNSQTYRFRNYGEKSNIPDNFIYTINQDIYGYLWIGTRDGISKFDGFEFHRIAYPDSTDGRYPTCCIRDKSGKLWFGCNDGMIFFTEGNLLKRLQIENTKSISSLAEAPDGSLWIIPQTDNIFHVNPDNPPEFKTYRFRKDAILFSASFTDSGDILIGNQENIDVLSVQNDSLVLKNTIQGFNYSNVTAIHRLNNSDLYLAGTNGSGLYLVSLNAQNEKPAPVSDLEELSYLDIQSVYEDQENICWISTNGSGVLSLRLSVKERTVSSYTFLNNNSGLPGNNIRSVFRDMEGNYWIGHFGDGLSMLPSLAFAFYAPGTEHEANNIICVSQISKDYFLGTTSGYYLFDIEGNRVKSYVDLKRGIGNNEITAFFVDNEDLWVGTDGGGLYLKESAGRLKTFYRSGNSSEDHILNIKINNNMIWLGTLNGVIILDRKSGKIRERFNTNNGLPYNRIDQICLLSDGNAAIATKADRLYVIDLDKGIIPGEAIMSGGTINVISSISRSNNGTIWAATAGNGVYKIMGDSLGSYTRADMLMSDYCYSILADSMDRIWIGHDRGFSCYDMNSGVMKTYSTDFARGGICNPSAMYESSDGKILIGTNEGLIVYDLRKDITNLQAPINNINYISVNDVIYPFRPSFILPYNKRYKIVIDYVGINLKEPEKVYYQTILENWDDDWSEWSTDRQITLSPRDGKYKFGLNSINGDGLSGEPVTFDLMIRTPFWRTWWFFLITAAVMAGIVILIIRQREKAQKKIELYLKTELEARTKEVVRQKGEIELKNIEITDSISYAKRIQTTILPDVNKLKDTFRDAFVFFKPRDIVSGDFYWFDRLNDDRFMLVCADSTGHGVPGAFMSMIGSTLLQDIITRQHITRPSEILKTLDSQLFSTLNQNIELGVSNDGMDMVVCEIGIKTNQIRFASAMRPVVIVLDGEPLYIKGNRSSIGGESITEKFFDDQEYFLKEGDSMYLFTDGLPDQFGGEEGKKMKIVRLNELIEKINTLPMPEQEEIITRFFEEWKGNYDQVDDILMMGIRF